MKCRECDNNIPKGRVALGYDKCLICGEEEAQQDGFESHADDDEDEDGEEEDEDAEYGESVDGDDDDSDEDDNGEKIKGLDPKAKEECKQQ